MGYHCVMECKNFKIKCSNCDEALNRELFEGHDCVAILKKNLAEARKEVKEIKKNAQSDISSHGYLVVTKKCNCGKPMTLINRQPSSYSCLMCDYCRREIDIHFKVTGHCADCKFDVCVDCLFAGRD